MKLTLSMPYVWSIYIVGTGLTLILNFLAFEALVYQLDWDWMMAISLAISTYALLTARQLYTHARLWPKKALLLTFPFSFAHLFFDAPFFLNLVICLVNLFFWWGAYYLSGRLVRLSPYGRQSGYL